MTKHVVAAVRDLPAGSRKAVSVKGRPIVVFNLVGEYFGLLDSSSPADGTAE
jgi:nitrite reductase/ring-hydroxylating ferredoxin subunit